jgi:hypothetical protein
MDETKTDVTLGLPEAARPLPVPSKDRDDWMLIKEQAKVAMVSGLMPKSITRPEQAAIIALKGRELGIPIMQALASISVINGKPALSAELMLALIYKRVPGARVVFKTPKEKQHLECEIEAFRGASPGQVFTFSMQDAERAGLLGNPSWKKYPQAMLRARCISAMARAVFPDAIMACHTPEELGHDEEELEEGHVAPQVLEGRMLPEGPEESRLSERFRKKE